ncbi:uncharacterized protein EV422DRAFT_136968 [Fimicolochytrium jonesii]|uniref:uncharacterized protein n=1 Tax=Fimicolochytrium jonesii TaxID=1396493 RepID=UPI0022FE5C3E|nr:uncharacterized protein EV422DRAFT_136968 [Fimicolochytrium jonesii]KAI8825688.1 hypothetical protein EV422DRAFT_136968 [Fimicolochytrium jonesii]
MSMGSSWQRFSRAEAPERGAFPLDLNGECQDFVKIYMACLKEAKGNNGRCKPLAREYLKCRMDHGLMNKEDFRNLGFHEDDAATSPEKPSISSATSATSATSAKK